MRSDASETRWKGSTTRGSWRHLLLGWVESRASARLGDTLVVLNLMLMSTPYADEPLALTHTRVVLDSCFAALFVVEMVTKLVAMGWGAYWSQVC